MRITSFYPEVYTTDAEAAVKLFSDLGFKRRHAPSVDSFVGDETGTLTRICMVDADGHRMDVVRVVGITHDMCGIRMNVDDLDEAHELLSAHGFEMVPAIEPLSLESARLLLMAAPTGLIIDLVQHIHHDA